MIRIWGRSTSSNVAKVLWTLDELRLEYEQKPVGGEVSPLGTDEYLRLNPNARIPTLEDGGLILWESNAIVRYLAARYGRSVLWPEDAVERARTDKWMDWASLNYAAALSTVRTAIKNAAPKAEIDTGLEKLDHLAGILDTAVEHNSYVGGERLGMGDIALAPHVHRWRRLNFRSAAHPALCRYHTQLCTHEYYRQHISQPLS